MSRLRAILGKRSRTDRDTMRDLVTALRAVRLFQTKGKCPICGHPEGGHNGRCALGEAERHLGVEP